MKFEYECLRPTMAVTGGFVRSGPLVTVFAAGDCKHFANGGLRLGPSVGLRRGEDERSEVVSSPLGQGGCDIALGVKRDHDGRVPEPLGHDLGVGPGSQSDGRIRVTVMRNSA